jgi:hypothetical protein
MKEKLRTLTIAMTISVMFTSCYTYTTVVGKGAQGATATSKWNNYVLWGLAPVGVSDPKVLAGGAEDYTVVTKHSFVNGLVSAITFGIYSPTTTTVTK